MPSTGIASTPEPPYYAAIFTSQRTDGDRGYEHTAQKMFALAASQPGFLGAESVRSLDGLGITVSYWESEQAIANWKANAEHQLVQQTGKKIWYTDYVIRIAKVERVYGKDNSKFQASSVKLQ
jgi:heme-degrading monooxygenase HmoA